jgi:uncharacterized membrane protein YjgN (DUF898 family)
LNPNETPHKAHSSFSFHGKGSELFLLNLKNWFLKLVTLGMYSFKAKVETRKYLWSHTQWNGQSFSFAGQAMDQVRGLGWLIAMGVGLILAAGVAGYTVHPLAALPFLYIGIALLVIRMKFGGFRYRVRNTVYRGIRGNVAPTAFDAYLKQSVKGAALTLVTLGIYRSFNQIHLMKIKWNNTSWGRQAFSFTGNGKEFFWLNFKGILLTMCTFGIYMPWYLAKRMRYSIGHIQFMNQPFKLDMTGGDLFLLGIMTIGVSICTLGIGLPWMMVHGMQMLSSKVSYTGEVDFAKIEADVRALKQNSGDMAGDVGDMDADFDFAV